MCRYHPYIRFEWLRKNTRNSCQNIPEPGQLHSKYSSFYFRDWRNIRQQHFTQQEETPERPLVGTVYLERWATLQSFCLRPWWQFWERVVCGQFRYAQTGSGVSPVAICMLLHHTAPMHLVTNAMCNHATLVACNILTAAARSCFVFGTSRISYGTENVTRWSWLWPSGIQRGVDSKYTDVSEVHTASIIAFMMQAVRASL
jgi:hypothetical protein